MSSRALKVLLVTGLMTAGIGCADAGRSPQVAGPPAHTASRQPSAHDTFGAKQKEPVYAVGTMTDLIVNPSGVTPARGDTPAHPGRRLLTTLWYPSAGDQRTTAQPAAAPLAGHFPLVVFAHGFATTPQHYAALLSAVASRGYVIAAPLFPISGSGLPGPPREDDMLAQTQDITAVISALVGHADQRAKALQGAIDVSHIAAAGHSDGAETVAEMLHYPQFSDPRISAAVIIAGRELPQPTSPNSRAATLVVQGGNDRLEPPFRGRGLYDELGQPKAYLTVAAGTHESLATGVGPGAELARNCIIAFLDTTLRHAPAAFMTLQREGYLPGKTQLLLSGQFG